MRTRRLYTALAAGAIAVAAGTGGLAIVGLAAGEASGAGASALCALAFFVPGLVFLTYSRKLRARDAALSHVARLAREAGILDLDRLTADLHLSRVDAERILRKAIAEGYVHGRFDREDHFIAEGVEPCPACGAARRKDEAVCGRCGARRGGG